VGSREGTPGTTCIEGASSVVPRSPPSEYLFSGLTKCASCGGGYILISQNLLGCATARNKGTCDNWLNIRRDALESHILDALRDKLMAPELFGAFCDEFVREFNRLHAEKHAALGDARAELGRVEREIQRLVDVILEGVSALSIKDRLLALEDRKAELGRVLQRAEAPPVLLHTQMATYYRNKVASLSAALNQDETRTEAAEIIRSLIDEILLAPANGELTVLLKGDLAGILKLAAKNDKRPSASDDLMAEQVEMVAGAGFEPATFGL
jgi:site-specific DNA recombinase